MKGQKKKKKEWRLLRGAAIDCTPHSPPLLHKKAAIGMSELSPSSLPSVVLFVPFVLWPCLCLQCVCSVNEGWDGGVSPLSPLSLFTHTHTHTVFSSGSLSLWGFASTQTLTDTDRQRDLVVVHALHCDSVVSSFIARTVMCVIILRH